MPGPAELLFLSQEDVVAAGGLEMGPTIEVVREALRLHALGDTRLPFKPMIRWGDGLDSEERDGRIMAMPAYVGGAMSMWGTLADTAWHRTNARDSLWSPPHLFMYSGGFIVWAAVVFALR